MQSSFNPKSQKTKHIKLDICSKHPEFIRMVDEIYSMLDVAGHKKKAKLHLNILLCNLYTLHAYITITNAEMRKGCFNISVILLLLVIKE